MTTNPHPTPEERYDAAVKDLKQVIEDEYGTEIDFGVMIEGQDLFKIAMTIAIREAEAAGEARGRAMERKEITARARRLRKRFGKCEGSFREEIIWGYGLRIEKMIRARTDKESSND